MGEAQNAPSGINNLKKRELLKNEGVLFDQKGALIDKARWWHDFQT